MAKVYLIKNKIEENLKKIYKELSKDFDPKEKTAIKVHFGEKGCTTHLDPELIKTLSKKHRKSFSNRMQCFIQRI